MHVSFCLSVLAVTFKCKAGAFNFVHRYIFTISRSCLSIKDTGSRLRSSETNVILYLTFSSISSDLVLKADSQINISMMISAGFCEPVTDNKCKRLNGDPINNFDCPDAEGLGMIWVLLLAYDIICRAKNSPLMAVKQSKQNLRKSINFLLLFTLTGDINWRSIYLQ